MLDAVDSGGYGVLGLYAVQAPVVSDPPQPAAATRADVQGASESGAAPASAAQTLSPAQAAGSPPVAPAASGDGGRETPGRDYAGQGEARSRQTAVAVSLYAAAGQSAGTASGQTAATTTFPSISGRALRAYGRSGASAGQGRPGASLSVRA